MVADRYFEREEAVAARTELGIDEFSEIALAVRPREWQSGCGGQPKYTYCGQCGGVVVPDFYIMEQQPVMRCTVCKDVRDVGP